MRVILAIFVLAVILAAIGLGWYLTSQRHRVRERRNRRLGHLRGVLAKADALLNQYSPIDVVGVHLERTAREILASYSTANGVACNDRQRLRNAEAAHSRLSKLIAQHPQSVFEPTDDVGKEFVRAMSQTLHPIQNPEIPHVP